MKSISVCNRGWGCLICLMTSVYNNRQNWTTRSFLTNITIREEILKNPFNPALQWLEMCINYLGVYCCITLFYERCNQSESAAVNSWLEEKLIYVVLKLVTKCYYRMIYILNCVKLKLMVRFSLRCSLIIVAVDRSSQLFHLLFNWQVQKEEIHD